MSPLFILLRGLKLCVNGEKIDSATGMLIKSEAPITLLMSIIFFLLKYRIAACKTGA